MSHRTAILLALCGVGINLLIIGPITLRAISEGRGDFLPFYISAELLQRGQLYDRGATLALQSEVSGLQMPSVMPIRLPFYYFLLGPLRLAGFLHARVIWAALGIAAVLGFVAFYPVRNREHLILACGASLPLVYGLVSGQDVAFLLLTAALSLRLRDKGEPFLAGLIASLLSTKYHLFFAVPLLFLVRREFRILGGMASGFVALMALSFAVAGPHWPVEYVKMIFTPDVSPAQSAMPNLHVFASWGEWGTYAEVALSVCVLALFVWTALRTDFEMAWAAALIAGLLLSRHSYLADCAVLIPALLTIAGNGGLAGRLAQLGLTPVPYFATMFGYGIVPAALLTATIAAQAPQPAPSTIQAHSPSSS